MILEGEFTLSAPIQRVWDTLLSPEILAACVPGCQQLEETDENTYASIVAAKVGAVSARFKFTTKLTEIEPPTHLKATGSGEEMSKMATFTQETVVNLEELSATEVKVSYRANVSIVGKLATFGDRIMKAKAVQMQDQFTQALSTRLASQTAEGPADEPADEPAAEAAEEPTDEAEAKPEAKPKAKAEPAAKPKAKPKAKAEPKAKPKAKPKAAAQSTAMTTPALNVTTWELIVAFFAVLWEKIVRLFKGSPK